jgi:membrane protein
MVQHKQTLLDLWERVTRTDISLTAAGIAFFCFLAIFPALAAVIAIWGFAFNPVVIQTQLDLVEGYVPAEAFDLLYGQVQRLLATNSRQLGLATIISTLFALWSARAGVGALIGGLNMIHGYPARNSGHGILRALLLTLILVAVALCAMALAVIAPLAIAFLPLLPVKSALLQALNFGLGLALVTMAISFTYRLGPHRPKNRKRPPFLTLGVLVALVLWASVSRGFVYYLANFTSYNQVYGSIGAVVALLMWIYLSAFAVLLGAAVDAERQKEPIETPDQ